MKQTRPNILWYCTDQQRFDTIRALGNDFIRTPNLDRFIETGVAFTQAYCQSPICTPSRASFLTGRYPSTTHVHRNGNSHFPEHETLVTKLFADAGYRCGLVGKLHLASAASGTEKRVDDGYEVFEWSHHPMAPADPHNAYHRWLIDEKGQNPDEICSGAATQPAGVAPEFHQTTWVTEQAIKFIDANDDAQQPWLLSLNVFDPHPPFDPPAEYLARYDPADLPGPLFDPSDIERQKAFSEVSQQSPVAADPNAGGEGAEADFGSPTIPPKSFDGRKIKAAYYAMIELIDAQFGRLVDHLERTGQLENTVIVFHSDHGELLGDHGLLYKGCRFFEGLVHVPLLVSWKGHFEQNVRSDALVELVDLAPTLLEAAGLDVPTSMQGTSLLSLLTGATPADAHKPIVVSEFNDALGSNADPRPTHATMSFDGRYKLIIYHGMDLGELFDLETDPGEFSNLWNREEFADIKCRLLLQHIDAVMATSSAGAERVGKY